MARQVITTVECAGKLLAPGIDFQQLSLTQSLFGQQSFSFTLPFERIESAQAGFFHQSPRQLLGQGITIHIESEAGFLLSKQPEPGLKFEGLITGLGTSKSSDFANSVSVNGYSPCYLLADGLQKRTFVGQSLQNIFAQVLAGYDSSLVYQLQPRHADKIAYVVQYRETDFTFLSRLASEYDEWFYYDGQTLRLGSPPTDGPPLDFVADGAYNTFHLSLELQPLRVKLYDYNYEQHQHFTSLTSSVSIPEASRHPFSRVVLEQSEHLFRRESHALAEMPIESSSQLEAEAKSLKAHRVAELVVLQGHSDNPGLQLGRVLQVRGQGLGYEHLRPEDFGLYRLIEITHHLDGQGNYRNSFTAIPHLLDVPPASPHYAPPVGSSELAEVIDDKDPKKLGRLRVRYQWPVERPQQAETDWLRVLTPYSGDGKGHLMKPEVGSQVIIGYQGGLAEQPFVLGNLFHGHNKQGASYSPANNSLKGIQTAGGNKVVMTDTKGEQKVLISNSNNKGTAVEVGFKGDGSITIKSNGPVTVLGSSITLEAGDKGEIKLHAKNVSIDAEEEIKITSASKSIALKAEKDITADATADMAFSAKKKTITTQGKLEISSSATVDISGTAVKING